MGPVPRCRHDAPADCSPAYFADPVADDVGALAGARGADVRGRPDRGPLRRPRDASTRAPTSRPFCPAPPPPTCSSAVRRLIGSSASSRACARPRTRIQLAPATRRLAPGAAAAGPEVRPSLPDEGDHRVAPPVAGVLAAGRAWLGRRYEGLRASSRRCGRVARRVAAVGSEDGSRGHRPPAGCADPRERLKAAVGDVFSVSRARPGPLPPRSTRCSASRSWLGSLCPTGLAGQDTRPAWVGGGARRRPLPEREPVRRVRAQPGRPGRGRRSARAGRPARPAPVDLPRGRRPRRPRCSARSRLGDRRHPGGRARRRHAGPGGRR